METINKRGMAIIEFQNFLKSEFSGYAEFNEFYKNKSKYFFADEYSTMDEKYQNVYGKKPTKKDWLRLYLRYKNK